MSSHDLLICQGTRCRWANCASHDKRCEQKRENTQLSIWSLLLLSGPSVHPSDRPSVRARPSDNLVRLFDRSTVRPPIRPSRVKPSHTSVRPTSRSNRRHASLSASPIVRASDRPTVRPSARLAEPPFAVRPTICATVRPSVCPPCPTPVEAPFQKSPEIRSRPKLIL